jgi:hypothetical protein
MINVLKYEDLVKIAKFLNENEYDNGNIDIVMYIETQERLNLLNLEYFKLNNKNEKYQNIGDISDINIKIGNVNFIYKLKNDKNHK